MQGMPNLSFLDSNVHQVVLIQLFIFIIQYDFQFTFVYTRSIVEVECVRWQLHVATGYLSNIGTISLSISNINYISTTASMDLG